MNIERKGISLSLTHMKIIGLLFLSAQPVFLVLSRINILTITPGVAEILSTIDLVAIPVLALTVVQDFLLEKSKVKYAGLLLGIGLFSEIQYDFLNDGKFIDIKNNNIFFFLVVSVVAVLLVSLVEKWAIRRIAKGTNRYFTRDVAEFIVWIIMFLLLSLVIDYLSYNGMMVIFIAVGIYLFRPNPIRAISAGMVILFIISGDYKPILMLIGVMPFLFYNGDEKEEKFITPYIFYPVILAILSVVKMMRIGV